MAGAVLKIDGTEVALGGPPGPVVHITLRQESGLAYLCKGVGSLARRKETPDPPRRRRRPGGGEQKVLGGTQILLGAVCIGLGVMLSVAAQAPDTGYWYNRAFYNGVPFWMGSLFILSGSFSVVGARHGGKWVYLATFLHLGSFVAGSVAFTLGLTDLAPLTYQPYFVMDLCKHRGEEGRYRSWEPTSSPSYDAQRDHERVKQCQEVLMALVRLWSSTEILLLTLHIVALLISLFCFGYGLRRLCCSCLGGWQDYVALEEGDASPAPEEPGKEQNPA